MSTAQTMTTTNNVAQQPQQTTYKYASGLERHQTHVYPNDDKCLIFEPNEYENINFTQVEKNGHFFVSEKILYFVLFTTNTFVKVSNDGGMRTIFRVFVPTSVLHMETQQIISSYERIIVNDPPLGEYHVSLNDDACEDDTTFVFFAKQNTKLSMPKFDKSQLRFSLPRLYLNPKDSLKFYFNGIDEKVEHNITDSNQWYWHTKPEIHFKKHYNVYFDYYVNGKFVQQSQVLYFCYADMFGPETWPSSDSITEKDCHKLHKVGFSLGETMKKEYELLEWRFNDGKRQWNDYVTISKHFKQITGFTPTFEYVAYCDNLLPLDSTISYELWYDKSNQVLLQGQVLISSIAPNALLEANNGIINLHNYASFEFYLDYTFLYKQVTSTSEVYDCDDFGNDKYWTTYHISPLSGTYNNVLVKNNMVEMCIQFTNKNETICLHVDANGRFSLNYDGKIFTSDDVAVLDLYVPLFKSVAKCLADTTIVLHQ